MPLTPPPNPNDAQARVAMREYGGSASDPPQSEPIIDEWHNEGYRTFSIDEVKRWFKVAGPLSEAARRE